LFGACPKEEQVSEPTINGAVARAEGREPKPKMPTASVSERGHTVAKAPLRSRSGPVVSLSATRTAYLDAIEKLEVDVDAEEGTILEGLDQIRRRRMKGAA